jgi:hypothetical protein
MGSIDIWAYRDPSVTGQELVGYEIEGVDGKLGTIDEATAEAGSSFLVVDTGPWIFGRKSMLPAGIVQRVDHGQERVYVDCVKDEVRSAPEFDESRYLEPSYRDEIAGYYTSGRAARAFDQPL